MQKNYLFTLCQVINKGTKTYHNTMIISYYGMKHIKYLAKASSLKTYSSL